MQTQEEIKKIASLANTTPEIVEAVLAAHVQVRYVLISPPGEAGHIFGAQRPRPTREDI